MKAKRAPFIPDARCDFYLFLPSEAQDSYYEEDIEDAAYQEDQCTDNVDLSSALLYVLLCRAVFSLAYRLSYPAKRHVPNSSSSLPDVIRL